MTTSEYENQLRALRKRWVEAVTKTMELDARWNRVNDEINRKLDAEGTTDIVQRTKIKGESLALKDALVGGNWWRGKAEFLAGCIRTEIMLHRELEQLRIRSLR